MSDEYFNIRKSVFVKALNCFDENLIARIMFNYCQDYDDLYNSCDSKDEREYFDFMHDLYKKVDEIMEKEKVKPCEWRLPEREMPVKERVFIKALNNVDGDLLDKVLETMHYGIEDIYTSFRSPDEQLLAKLMIDLVKEADKLQAKPEKKFYDPDYEAWKKDPDNPIWKTLD